MFSLLPALIVREPSEFSLNSPFFRVISPLLFSRLLYLYRVMLPESVTTLPLESVFRFNSVGKLLELAKASFIASCASESMVEYIFNPPLYTIF